MADGDHKVLAMLCKWGGALTAVVIAVLAIDGRYISEAEAASQKQTLEAKIADTSKDQAKSAKNQAVYNEISMLETQARILDLELTFIAEKPKATTRDSLRTVYLQQSIAAMQSRVLVLRGDLAGGDGT